MTDLLQIHGPEQSLFVEGIPDGGLPPVVGVQSWCVFRASKDVPELSDGYGWTYHHHVDMACWKGKLYVGWNSCEKDEDVWPSRELLSTSDDGRTWTAPRELFPQGVSAPLRMYFFHASNGRMLAIAGLRVDLTDTDEDRKFGLVVREIHPDHQLGDVFTLQTASGDLTDRPRFFEDSIDSGFVEACRALLADKVYLEQQDRGRLLGERRMKWHDAAAWPAGSVPGDSEKWVAGKAYSFFRRPDGAIIGISKMGWTTISTDNGETWAQPVVPSTLITGKAKVWAQQTSDGKYALVYNPSRRQRYPLVIVTSGDGVHYRDMRLIHGELPRQRYKGKFRSVGPQYVRGISHWANDHSRGDKALWLVYSMSKEDIWVSSVPLPVQAEVPSGIATSWNTYCPKWDSIDACGDDLSITSRDPWDNALATRIFSDSAQVSIRFAIQPVQNNLGQLAIHLHPRFGAAPLLQIILNDNGKILIRAGEEETEAGEYDSQTPLTFNIQADSSAHRLGLTISSPEGLSRRFDCPIDARLHRISYRAGKALPIQASDPVPARSDAPLPPTIFHINGLRVQS